MKNFASSCRRRSHSNFPSQCQEPLDIGFKSSKSLPVTIADLQDSKVDLPNLPHLCHEREVYMAS